MRGLPALLDRLGEDGRLAATHSDMHTEVPRTGEGIINLLAGGHEHVRDEIRTFFLAVDGDVAGPAATRVRDSLTAYADTERRNAEALARIVPGTSSGDVPGAAGSVDAFADRVEPSSHLAPPPDHEATFPHEPGWWDIASPGALLRDSIWAVTDVATGMGICDRPYDIYEWVLKPVVGDWAAIRECADVLVSLADAAAAMSTNVADAAGTTTSLWTGDAGDGCARYLFRAAEALAAAEQPLRATATEYVAAAQAMNDLRGALTALLDQVADAAIMAAASGAVVALAGATGVGLPIALIVGAFTLTLLYKVVRGLMKVFKLIGDADAAADAQNSAFASFGLLDSAVDLPTLPSVQ